MSKNSIRWHQNCFHNLSLSLQEKEDELNTRVEYLRSEIQKMTSQKNFYSKQIESAIAKGMDSFDRDRFMKRRVNLPTKEDCLFCPAKSADCAHGDLRGSQSCEDTRQRFSKK